MSIASVLAQLSKSCAVVPPEPYAHPHFPEMQSRPAAVLVPILDYDTHATILLTKRTAHLSAHAGQICFPGGMWEEADDSLLATALRETEEELGIPAERIRIIGEGRGRITGTGFQITPFLAHIAAPVEYRPDPYEVESAFELPLERAIKTSAYQILRIEHKGVKYPHDMLQYEGHCIWGATAGILRDMCRMINGERWEDPTC